VPWSQFYFYSAGVGIQILAHIVKKKAGSRSK
jgi:hypothetical protein